MDVKTVCGKWIVVGALALASQIGLAEPGVGSLGRRPGADSSFSVEMMKSMAAMDRGMSSAPMNGDPDHDFASMMIPHHQGAVDMAKIALLHCKDPVLRRLAEEIVVTQRQEIEVMQMRLTAMAAKKTPSGSRTKPAAPQGKGIIPVSARDRVYTGDQSSNTVSVINPATNTLLGVIRLGEPEPGALSPLYRGQLLVHGLGFSPDHRTLVAVSIGSNSVTFIDTATNKVKGVTYIGRSPHEAFFTPNGKQVWAVVRGEDYVSVIDASTMKEVKRIRTANGPGMVLFRPDARYAFVPSSFTPEVDVIDMRTYAVVARVPQASPFSPNLAVSQDGSEVWFTLKDSGKTQVMSARPPFRILHTFSTGPITNHVALVDSPSGKFAYITVGGENVVKVFRRGANPKMVATIPTGDLPHGIWQSGDGSRVYVGLENQDAVIGIDTATNKIIATMPIGLQPQAVVYVPNAVPVGDGTDNLMPLKGLGDAIHLTLRAPIGSDPKAQATVSVNSVGPIDLIQVAPVGLVPGHSYRLCLVDTPTAPFGQSQTLATFKTNMAGAQIVQALGPFRTVLSSGAETPEESRRFLVVVSVDTGDPVLVEAP